MVILIYHLVGGGTSSPVDVTVGAFESHMRELASHGLVCSLDRALGALQRREKTLRVVLTFDDAFENFHRHAWPLLRQLRLPFTLYVPTGFVLGRCPAPLAGADSLPGMSWRQLGEIRASDLATIGSHSHTHADLRRLSEHQLEHELGTSAELLEERLGERPRHFAYPRALCSRPAERVVSRFYRTAAIAGGRVNQGGSWNPYRLSRIPVRTEMGDSLEHVIGRTVWLEEWIASRARALRPAL